MSKVALAVKYRPKEWKDVVEQDSTKTILQQQLETNSTKNAYLFCGPAGDGKTTTARIFANEINQHKGTPIELDAASNSSVDDVREIIQQAKLKALESEYKVFIIDECHSLSNTAWQAFLKLIEEPPAKSIFIFCTTNPEKIPKTILSRVQRYDFKRISQEGIVSRLAYILDEEDIHHYNAKDWLEGVTYIAKLADGGMRDAITMMDKCLSYSKELTIDNVVKALGTVNYDNMIYLTNDVIHKIPIGVIEKIEKIHSDGIDLKQFIRQYVNFILDVKKWFITDSFEYIQIPETENNKLWLHNLSNDAYDIISDLLSALIKLNSEIKYDSSPKYTVEAYLLEVIK